MSYSHLKTLQCAIIVANHQRPVERSKHGQRKNVTGKRIRQARAILQPPMSQRQLVRKLLAKGIDVDQSVISRIENQERLVTDIELIAIAKFLKVTVAWLCKESNQMR